MTKPEKPQTGELHEQESRVGTFTFLDDADAGQLLEPGFVRNLAHGVELSPQDQGILDDICDSLAKSKTLPFSWTPQEAHYVEKQPQSKWLDYLIYRYKFTLFPKKKIIADFPVYLLVEPASTCNLRCVMCFQVDKSFTRKPYMGLMDMGLFREVIDEAHAGGTQAITLASRGEPTLHPELGSMLEYMAGKFIEVKLTTNGTRLPEKLCHQILESGANMVVFSIDAHTKDIYEDVRVRGKFDEVLTNVQRFHDIRAKDYPNTALSTRVSGVRVRDAQDPDAFKEFWGKIVDEVGMKDTMERWNTYENEITPDITSPCHFLWERLYIWFDGITNPCNPDYKSTLTPGSVKGRSIRDVWHGPELTRLREAHLNGKRADYSPCDRCGLSFE